MFYSWPCICLCSLRKWCNGTAAVLRFRGTRSLFVGSVLQWFDRFVSPLRSDPRISFSDRQCLFIIQVIRCLLSTLWCFFAAFTRNLSLRGRLWYRRYDASGLWVCRQLHWDQWCSLIFPWSVKWTFWSKLIDYCLVCLFLID